MAYDPTQHAGAGLDELDASSKMPLLNIIQQNSPQLNDKKDQFIEGSKAGEIFFSPTQEVLGTMVPFIPTALRTLYVEWRTRDNGGGIVGMHPLDIQGRKDLGYEQGRKGQYDEWLGDNELKKTTYVLGLITIGDEQVEGMVALSVTGQKTARALQDSIRKFRYDGKLADIPPAIYARQYTLEAVYEENAKGEGYYNYKFNAPRVLDFKKDEALLNAASSSRETSLVSLPALKSDTPPVPTLETAVVDEDNPPF